MRPVGSGLARCIGMSFGNLDLRNHDDRATIERIKVRSASKMSQHVGVSMEVLADF